MPPSSIPESVRQLVLDHIPTVERLEILLLLAEGRASAWTIEQIEEQIRSTPESVRQNVSALIASGLVDPDGHARHRYRDPNPLGPAVTELATVYRTRRVAVVELIYAERRPPVRSFSDAFKLGRPHDR